VGYPFWEGIAVCEVYVVHSEQYTNHEDESKQNAYG
jgi:hypothetical protein